MNWHMVVSICTEKTVLTNAEVCGSPKENYQLVENEMTPSSRRVGSKKQSTIQCLLRRWVEPDTCLTKSIGARARASVDVGVISCLSNRV